MWSAVDFFCLEAKLCIMWTTLFCILPPRTVGWLYPVRTQIISTKNLTRVAYFDLRTEAVTLVLTQFVRWSNWSSAWRTALTEQPCPISRCCVNCNYRVCGRAGWDRAAPRLPLGRGKAAWGWKGSSLGLEIRKLLGLQLCAALLSLGDQPVGPQRPALQSFELQLLKSGITRYLEDCCILSLISIK